MAIENTRESKELLVKSTSKEGAGEIAKTIEDMKPIININGANISYLSGKMIYTGPISPVSILDPNKHPAYNITIEFTDMFIEGSGTAAFVKLLMERYCPIKDDAESN